MSDLDIADRALTFADGDAQVTVIGERSLSSRYARSQPTQATEIDDLTVHVLVLRDGQTGTATTNATDDTSLRATVRRAADAAAAAATQGRGDYPGLPAPQSADSEPHAGHDAATAELDPATAGAALATAFAVAREHGCDAFGLWSAAEVRTAIASSAGVRARDAVTDTYFKVICRDAGGRSGLGAAMAPAASAIDPEAVARRAAARMPRGEQAELPPGSYPVVLAEEAVGLLLDFLGGLGFNGLAHAEGRGAMTGRLGAQVVAPSITLTDAPRHALTLPRAFDAEGVPKRELALIEDGVARQVVHDTRSAARAGDGARSTGHAILPGGSPFGAAATNLVLSGGDAEGEEALAAPIERGLYVTRFWYVNAVQPKETLLTGVTRDGTFLIEDGRITRPLRDVRFTDTALGVLERVEALGSQPRLVGEAEFYGRRFATGTVCPSVRSGAIRITGGA